MTTVTRPALLSAVAYILQAIGATPAELAQHIGQAALIALPVTDGVDIDAVHRREPAPAPAPIHPPMVANSWPKRPPAQRQRKLTPQAEHVLKLADRAEGITVVDVMAELGIQEPTAHRHCQRLADELRLLTRVKAPGDRAHRFFARPAQATAYFEAGKAGQQREAEPKTVKTDPEAPRAVLSDLEVKALHTKLAKQAGAHKAPPPLGPRTTRKPPSTENAKNNITFSPQKTGGGSQLRGDAVETAATRRTVDDTKRPTARWQAQQLPADPRWPSFSSAPLGCDPATGKPWERRA